MNERIQARIDTLTAEREQARAQYQEAHAIVQRLAVAIPQYDAAIGELEALLLPQDAPDAPDETQPDATAPQEAA